MRMMSEESPMYAFGQVRTKVGFFRYLRRVVNVIGP
jgi:hypothetical protein